MAASLSDVKVHTSKRKLNELDDITNTNYEKKPKKLHTIQQRSPSPVDMAASGKPRNKSVSFELLNNKHYESSPLLTPKDDDDDDEIMAGDSNFINCNDYYQNLNLNPDYLSLTSSLRLLESNKLKILNDINQLSNILKLINYNDKSVIVKFFINLINNDLNLPKQHRILTAPVINWSKYSYGADKNADPGLDPAHLFKRINVFSNNDYKK